MKICSKCKQIKPISEFYKGRNNKDGLQNYCKICEREYQQSEKYKAYRQSENIKAYQKAYHQSENGKAANKRYKVNHPNKIKAQSAVCTAIEAGRLSRPDTLQCSYCPTRAEQYHHPSYMPEHRLDVEPVCRKCHRKLHKKIA